MFMFACMLTVCFDAGGQDKLKVVSSDSLEEERVREEHMNTYRMLLC